MGTHQFRLIAGLHGDRQGGLVQSRRVSRSSEVVLGLAEAVERTSLARAIADRPG